jgi:DNA-binding FrmR family transcriptional regulator
MDMLYDLAPEALVIVLTIAGLLVISLINGLGERRRYVRETNSLGRVERELGLWRQEGGHRVDPATEEKSGANPSESDSMPDATKPASEDSLESDPVHAGDEPTDASDTGHSSTDTIRQAPLIEINTLIGKASTGTLIYERLDAIKRMREHKVKVSATVLQQLTAAREESRLGSDLHGFVGGIMMLLGILGTFIGLASVVSDISAQLPNTGEAATLASVIESVNSIKDVVGGMTTAFATSIVGMSSALLVFVFGFLIAHQRAQLLNRVEHFTVKELLPATIPVVEDETLLEEVSNRVGDSFRMLDHAIGANRQVLRQLTATEQAVANMIEEVRQITKTQASRDLDRVIEALGKTGTAMNEVTEHLPKVVESIRANAKVLDSLTRSQRHSLLLNVSAPQVIGFTVAVVVVWVLVRVLT